MPLTALCLALIAPPAPISLTRKFVANEKLAYNVNSHITAESRGQGLETFIPEDFDINYGLVYTVLGLKADGIAVVRFQQPSITEIQGETATSGPKSKTEKSNKVYQFSVSPINEIIDAKDVTPEPPKKKPTKKPGKGEAFYVRSAVGAAPVQGGLMGEFVGEMHRLALFVGQLNFAPSLPLEPVKVGDTWKRTVGYQPQKLKGKNKSAVQRLDYVYTYLGPMKSEAGKPILRVQAKLDLDTDLVDYIKTLLEGTDIELPYKSMPLHMKATIDFDLDPVTRHTLSAFATSEGGFEINVKEISDAVYEERFKGRTNMMLTGRKIGVK